MIIFKTSKLKTSAIRLLLVACEFCVILSSLVLFFGSKDLYCVIYADQCFGDGILSMNGIVIIRLNLNVSGN